MLRRDAPRTRHEAPNSTPQPLNNSNTQTLLTQTLHPSPFTLEIRDEAHEVDADLRAGRRIGDAQRHVHLLLLCREDNVVSADRMRLRLADRWNVRIPLFYPCCSFAVPSPDHPDVVLSYRFFGSGLL